MKVILEPGDSLIVELHETDGLFRINYDHMTEQNHLTVWAELPDSSGREGVIYDEDFSSIPEGEEIDAGAQT